MAMRRDPDPMVRAVVYAFRASGALLRAVVLAEAELRKRADADPKTMRALRHALNLAKVHAKADTG